MSNLTESRPVVKPIDCPETIESVTLPFIEEQIDLLSKRIHAALASADNLAVDSRDFALRMLVEAREELPEDLDLTETVFRRAVAASSLWVAAREVERVTK